MKFRSEVTVKKLPVQVNHRHKLLLVGSCFTENIGEKLERGKFTTLQNPNGILFNPVSVAEALVDYVEDTEIGTADLFQWNEAWHSWKHHSRFSGYTAAEAKEKINASTNAAHRFLKDADVLFLTLGSAWTYVLTAAAPGGRAGAVAANNHKAPATWFQRRLLTTEQVLSVLDNAVHRLFHFNPKLQVVFTISPVRHLREGAVDNNRSKAVLIGAVHHLVDKFDRLHYFPAYELVIDDLRDYRFYAEDLVHPNYFATQYVWEKLVGSCINEASIKLMAEIEELNRACQHKPFHPASASHLAFREKYKAIAEALQQAHPHLDFRKEISFFSS